MTWQEVYPGWRELQIGEQIQRGDRYVYKDISSDKCETSIGSFYRTTGPQFAHNFERKSSNLSIAVITLRPKFPLTQAEHSASLNKNRIGI